MYPQLWDWENLYLAYRKARKGKRSRPPAAGFEFNLESNLIGLQQALRDKSYTPGQYSSFYIHEPKRRLISAAPFADRVVHHALCNIIEPIFERSFIFDSYANRKEKGTHRALDRAQSFAKRFRYVLPLDVRQFFPSIDHAILRATLAHKIADADVLSLIDRILASGVGILISHPNAQPRPVTEGIPFLGFVVYPTHRLVKRRKVVYYRRKLRTLLTDYQAGKTQRHRLQTSLLGWINHVRYGDTWGLRRSLLQPVKL